MRDNRASRKFIATLVAANLAAFSFVSSAEAKPVSVFAKSFSNCTELRKVYPGGVALSSKVRNKGGATKHKPKVNKSLYLQNRTKDRDGDGIACEN